MRRGVGRVRRGVGREGGGREEGSGTSTEVRLRDYVHVQEVTLTDTLREGKRENIKVSWIADW